MADTSECIGRCAQLSVELELMKGKHEREMQALRHGYNMAVKDRDQAIEDCLELTSMQERVEAYEDLVARFRFGVYRYNGIYNVDEMLAALEAIRG